MKFLLSILGCLCLLSLSVSAQNTVRKPASDSDSPNSFWTGNFATGQIMVNIHKIASVSQQKYLLDGQFIVYEVSIDVDGNALTRIYYIEPLAESSSSSAVNAVTERAKSVFGSVQDRATNGNLDINTTVSKSYPATTHSHTIEYRVSSLEEVNMVYKSLCVALQRGQGRTFTYSK